MIARQKVDEEVLSFYVTLPFTHQIVLVDLVNKTVHAPLRSSFDEAVNQYGGKCLRPQILGAESNNVLLVTTRSGFLVSTHKQVKTNSLLILIRILMDEL